MERDQLVPADPSSKSRASSYIIPPLNFTVFEHPFIVKDTPKVVNSLGGVDVIRSLVTAQEGRQQTARLFLRPDDPYSRPVESFNVPSENICLRVDFPRRTGKRRKRGTDEPFQHVDFEIGKGETRRLKAYRDNPGRSKVTIVGQVTQTHRFRSPPDFVWASDTNAFLSRIKDTLLSVSYSKISEFNINTENAPFELIPPPVITPTAMPWAYSYRQDASVKTIEVDGQLRTFNTTSQSRKPVISVRCDDVTVPDPDKQTLEDSTRALSSNDQETVRRMQSYFETRPIWTRRGIRNVLRAEGMVQQFDEHHIIAHVAYTFSSGPWRDALVRYGKDPRTDPAMRMYQTMAFRTDDSDIRRGTAKASGQAACLLDTKRQAVKPLNFPTPPPGRSHVFDGSAVDITGKIWQACDVTEATIRILLDTADIREVCDVKMSGWYFNGTWSKVRAIMKLQISHLIETGKSLDVANNRHVQRVLELPEQLSESNFTQAVGDNNKRGRGLLETPMGPRAASRKPPRKFGKRNEAPALLASQSHSPGVEIAVQVQDIDAQDSPEYDGMAEILEELANDVSRPFDGDESDRANGTDDQDER